MSAWLGYALCLIIILFTVKGTVTESLEEREIKYSLNRLIYYFSIFITFFYMIINLDSIYLNLLKIINNYIKVNNFSVNMVKVIGFATFFFVCHFIIYQILCFLSKFFINIYEFAINKIKFLLVIFSMILGVFKGLVIISILFIGVITINGTILNGRGITVFNDLKSYQNFEKLIAINRHMISYDEYKEHLPIDSNIIVYYNGVTLEEGIKSSKEIDAKAMKIIYGFKSDREKAKSLYAWVGSNIKYDFEKANKALSNENINNSGAIEAWKTRKGICFDYACLYVAMCRKAELKVRLITGKAFDGKNYVPHAWNEVYLEDERKWINVDPTFYISGDNFDNEDFNVNHKKENVAGEW